MHTGGVGFGASLAQRIAAAFAQAPAPQTVAFPQLADREREVLDLVAAGRSNAQIPGTLFLSPKTVGNHVQNVYAKIGVTTRAGATLFAIDNGLLRPGSET